MSIKPGGLSPGSQHDQLVVAGPATLAGTLEVSLLNGFVPAVGNGFEVLRCQSRSGAFHSSNAGHLNLTEAYSATNLVLIAGSNAFPNVAFTVSGGNLQTVCVPFQLLATGSDPDGLVTNLTVFLDGSTFASSGGAPLANLVEFDFPAVHAFVARALDDKGAATATTQEVTVATYPLHRLVPGGFRANGVFKLCMAGEEGRSYQVLASPDPETTNWVILGVMDSTNGTWRFLDPTATNAVRRF